MFSKLLSHKTFLKFFLSCYWSCESCLARLRKSHYNSHITPTNHKMIELKLTNWCIWQNLIFVCSCNVKSTSSIHFCACSEINGSWSLISSWLAQLFIFSDDVASILHLPGNCSYCKREKRRITPVFRVGLHSK